MEPGILIRPSTIGMILISIIGVPVFAQTNGNITTPVIPQGTSLDITNDSSAENLPETSSGNITTPVVPQGTSLNVSEDIAFPENERYYDLWKYNYPRRSAGHLAGYNKR